MGVAAGESEFKCRGQTNVVWPEAGLWLALLKAADGIAWSRWSVPPGSDRDEVIENAKQTIDDGHRCNASTTHMKSGAAQS